MQEKERQRQQERQQRLGAPGEQLLQQTTASLCMLHSCHSLGPHQPTQMATAGCENVRPTLATASTMVQLQHMNMCIEAPLA
jgi:hypothetical protein